MELGEGLVALVGELRELEEWPEVQLHAGLLLSEVLRALGVPEGQVVELLGFDAAEYEGGRGLRTED